FEGSPRILEALFTGLFFGSIVYFLRPKMTIVVSSDAFKPKFRGQLIEAIRFNYVDLPMGLNLSVLTALIVAPNIGGDVGSLIAPAGTAFIFKKFIELTFPQDEMIPYTQIFTDV